MSDRYELREQIGEGGLGTVHRAYDRNLDREVAVKRVSTAALGAGEDSANMALALLKEARTLSALMHPNIVTVFDAGEDDEGPYVVMELLKGETLEDTVKRGALPYEDFEQLVQQALEGMIAAQAADLVHRDIKPANLMVIWLPSGKFQVKILDFGLAQFGKQPRIESGTRPASMLGSIYFMAPEQFENKEVDARTDLYSLGAVFYFALTGRYPFRGETAPQVMASHLQHACTPLGKLRPDLPEWLSGWIDQLMSRHPEERPASAVDALDRFHQLRSGKAAGPAQGQSQPAKKLMRPAGTASAGTDAATGAPKKMMRKADQAPAAASPPQAADALGAPTIKLMRPGGAQTQPSPQDPASTAGAPAKKLMRPAGATPPSEVAPPAEAPKKMMRKAGAAAAASPAAATPSAPAAVEAMAVVPIDDDDVVPVTPVAAVAPSEDMVLTEEEARAMTGATVGGVLSKIPRWAYITVPLLVLIGLGLGTMTLLDSARQREALQRFSELVTMDPPRGEIDDLRLVGSYLDDPQHSGVAARIMWEFEGENEIAIDQEILRQLQRARTSLARANLIRVVGLRGIPEATPVLLELTRDDDAATRRAAWNALGFTATQRQVTDLVGRLDEVEDNERQYAEESIINLARSMPDENARVGMLMVAYRATDRRETKRSMFRIMARLGGQRAWEELTQALRGSANETKRDAAAALSGWPSHEPLPELLRLLETETDPPTRIVAARSAATVAAHPGSTPQEKLFELVTDALEFITDPRERNDIYTAIANLVCDESLRFFENLDDDDPAMRAQAAYVRQVQSALSRVVDVAGNGTTEIPLASLHMMAEGPRVTADNLLFNWVYANEWIALYVSVDQPGTLHLIMDQASDTTEAGTLNLVAGNRPREVRTIGTGSVDEFAELDLGAISFPAAGHYRIWLQPEEIPGEEFLRVRSMRLENR